MNEIIEPGTAIAAAPAMSTSLAVTAPMTPMELISNAVANGASIEMVERLMALQEKMEANEARKAFVAAMAEFKAEPLTISKNKHVNFSTSKGETDYDHATLD